MILFTKVNIYGFVKVGMKLLNVETLATRNAMRKISLNTQDFYFRNVAYTIYDESTFMEQTD
jgi:hypothetical protein